jgi:YfiH family protein
MLSQIRDNPGLLHFDLLRSCAGLAHAVSTRMDPSESETMFDLAWTPGEAPEPVRSRLRAVAAALKVDPDHVCCARQVHGIRVQCIDVVPAADPGAPCRVCGECDALITDQPGSTLLIRVADCVPIVLYDPVHRVVTAIHAGWKGTLADIAGATVARMCTHYGCRARDILAGIGPSIGPCCFDVNEDVARQFRKAFFGDNCVLTGPGGIKVDLPEANRAALLRSGMLPGNIEMAGYCTACRLDIFFSHRGEKGDTGRFGLFAGLRAR